MTALTVRPVEGRGEFEAFLRLPATLYRGHPGFAPHLWMERRETLDFRRNPYFKHAKGRYWLAWRGGRPVGRISAQVDDLYLARYRDETGHIGLLDIADDAEAFAGLTAAAEDWLRGQGMKRATGPFSLSINEELGLLVEGFGARSTLLMGYNPAYAGPRLEACGYARLKDLIAYDYDIVNAPQTIGAKLAARLPEGGRIRLRRPDLSRFREELGSLLDIFNDAWRDNWGFVPLTEEEIAAAAKSLRMLVVRDLVWFADVGEEPAAMILALPNLNEAIADLGGRLLPFGWARLLWRLKVRGVKTTRVPLMGVRKAYQNTPVGAALALMVIDALRENGKRLGYTHAELGWILEDNKVTRKIIESVGGRAYKTYRLYEKPLA